ncbi:transglutaminase-like cysteine peptidase [Devosia sp. XJ19-1]|uniref:Transglutaminase-like cysteine peptidase n=1 Tax=Devosia ureilytica TaxID=2952754 RepID=A0A9Q4AM50_9HYPH|nr:transglutaminase-like cysteine peptidase [Devosia ureilytica]MCP8881884.1 transglutaminase-like cysteine peptidase [Devosia ureilytica]MCP8886230.1 transglutaminase-like cysteine peptidase [Devosia ureilytica]
MSFNKKALLAGIISALLALAPAAPAAALDFTNVAFVQTAVGTTSIPVGHLEFCNSHPGECNPNDRVVPATQLTDTNWQQLVSINGYYNQNVVPVTDQDLYKVAEFWTYPNGYGDCEDFALAKRRDLINSGWHPSTLMIAVVKEANGNGHAVLLARTDRGDLVLDNQDGSIRLWNETPYTFIKRQSQANAGQWVDMIDDRVLVVAAAN